MKVSIYGDDLTPANFASVINTLNEKCGQKGLQVANATCYFRFVNEDGQPADATGENGEEITLTFNFERADKTKKPIQKINVADLF